MFHQCEYTPEESVLEAARKKNQAPVKVTDASVFSEELLMAGSTAKQAEVAAKQIYRIRESRMTSLRETPITSRPTAKR